MNEQEIKERAEAMGKADMLDWIKQSPPWAYPDGENTNPAYWIRHAEKDLKRALYVIEKAGLRVV